MIKTRSHILTFVDTETTGLDPYKHELISIGIIEVKETQSEQGLTHELLGEYEYKIKPERLDLADPIALKINKYTEHDWVGAIGRQEALAVVGLHLIKPDQTEPKINDVIVVGHNVHFDVLMIGAFFREGGQGWNPRHALDTYTLARKILRKDIDVESYALGSLCNYYGVDNEMAHTALSDTRACLELYQKLMAVELV